MKNTTELIRWADPADHHLVIRGTDARAVAMIERILTQPVAEGSTRFTTNQSSRRTFIAVSAVAGAAALFALFQPLAGAPSASASVRSAVDKSIAASSGRAMVRIEGSSQRASSANVVGNDPALVGQPFVGTINIAWSGRNESYDHDSSEIGKWSIRVIDGTTYLSNNGGPWTEARPEQSYQAGLAGSADQFDVLRKGITFRFDGSDSIDGIEYRHVVATGDLSPMDSTTSRAGFLFGTNGAPGAKTTSLELWLNDADGIRRIRSTFSGRDTVDDDAVDLVAMMTTDLSDIGKDITITK